MLHILLSIMLTIGLGALKFNLYFTTTDTYQHIGCVIPLHDVELCDLNIIKLHVGKWFSRSEGTWLCFRSHVIIDHSARSYTRVETLLQISTCGIIGMWMCNSKKLP